MMLTLDSLSQRYGQLPSSVMQNGSTFDLAVIDLAFKWERIQRERANNPNYKPEKPKANLTQEQMRAMIQAVRKKDAK
jgi:hypothetical protein